ncbi:MAG TPA: proton-conducting transporter membrane subunit [Bacteroidales bacterium]|nr:proton-conducting transporter membrane subunit [Bacteroidales bacterium]
MFKETYQWGDRTINLFIMLGVVFPLVLLPVVLFGSLKWRYLAILLFVGTLLSLAWYNLADLRLGTTILLERLILAPLAFQEYPYSKIVVFGFTLTGAMALLYGVQLSKPSEQAAALIALASVIGVSFADNLITLFVFWEMLTFATAALILLKKTPEAIIAGSYFLFFHLAGGLLVLLGILQNYAVTGAYLIGEPQGGAIFFTIGFGFKAAFLPLHFWVAKCYPAASFASTVILAGLTTKIGVYAIARILPPHEAIMLMGVSMAIVGAVCAFFQDNMRRLLAYSTVSQVGYIVAGVGLGLSLGVDGGFLHLINHMLYKALLFMSAGAVLFATGTENMRDLRPGDVGDEEGVTLRQYIWKAMPLVTIAAVIGALSITGAPLFNGYVSKYLLKSAMTGLGPAEWVLMIAGIVTAATMCKFIYFGFIIARGRVTNQLPVGSQVAIVVTAGCCVLLGIYPQVVSSLLPGGSSLDVYNPRGIWDSSRLIIAGVLVFLNVANLAQRSLNMPPWLSTEYFIMAPLGSMGLKLFSDYGVKLDLSVNNLFALSGQWLLQLCRYIALMDKSFDQIFGDGYARIGNVAQRVTGRSGDPDESVAGDYTRNGNVDSHTVLDSDDFHSHIDSAKSMLHLNPVKWSTKNLNFDSLLLALLLVAVLIVIFYYGL